MIRIECRIAVRGTLRYNHVYLVYTQQYHDSQPDVPNTSKPISSFRRVRKIAKSDCYLHQVCPSVCMQQLGYRWKDFREDSYLGICRKFVQKIPSFIKVERISGTVHEDLVVSRDENAGRNHSVRNDNSAFEKVDEFKYLGTTLTNQNSIQEEIKSRLKSGKACYLSFGAESFVLQVAIQKLKV